MVLCHGGCSRYINACLAHDVSKEWIDSNLRRICCICTENKYHWSQIYPELLQGISFYTGKVLAPYKIIYIVLGGLAIVVGICVLIWLPDSPVHAQFLTKEERIAALERVRDDQGGTENKTLKKYQIFEALTDIRTWLIILTTFFSMFTCAFSPPHEPRLIDFISEHT